MVESSLAYYVSALQESISSGSVATSFAGQNSSTNNSTLVNGISSYNQCSGSSGSNSGGISGFFTSVGNVIRNAACEVSSFVGSTVQELDAARGYLDGAAEETPGQRNATFTNVDVGTYPKERCIDQS